MKILHVIGGLARRYGGPSTVVPEMAKAVADRGHCVEIFTTDIDGPTRLSVPTGSAVRWLGVPTTFFRVHRPNSYAASLGLGAAIRRRVAEYDVVHIHSLYLFHTFVASHYSRRFAIPYLLCPHGVLDPIHNSRHKWRKAVYTTLTESRTTNGAAGLHYCSEAERDYAARLGIRARAFVVPLGVDASVLNRPSEPRRLLEAHPQLADRTLVTFVGRLARVKRLDLLIDGFTAIAKCNPEAHLVLAGPDDEGVGRRLRETVRANDIGNQVSFLGFVTGDIKTTLLQQSDVFVLPSDEESFGVSVVEAMATGLPVVVTTGVPLHREIATAGAGFVVPSTATAIAEALRSILADQALRESMGRRGRHLAHSSFAWSQIAVNLEDMYSQAVKSHTGRQYQNKVESR